jgi:hypothetical protein
LARLAGLAGLAVAAAARLAAARLAAAALLALSVFLATASLVCLAGLTHDHEDPGVRCEACAQVEANVDSLRHASAAAACTAICLVAIAAWLLVCPPSSLATETLSLVALKTQMNT